MKVSLNTIRFVNKHYESAGDPAPDGVDKLVEKIGAQLAAVEDVITFGKQFEGILVVKVVACQSHGNADKLKVCLVDDGGKVADVERDANGHVQIVCGAPNAREGILAVWIPPGVTVPSTASKDPLVIKSLDIRGQTSHGMMASLHELGISDDHSGILEVDVDAAPGTSFVEAYNLVDEAVIEMENKMFTHRPDCFGQLGIARELEGIQQRAYKSPAWYTQNPTLPAIETDELKLEVHNDIPNLVPRFTAVTMANVTVKPSPVWSQIFLAEVGLLRPINNIVDYTNFFMLETGQPLHAYDYDKLLAISKQPEASLEVRTSRKGDKITLLGGKQLELKDESTILITSGDVPVGIGGVMGGADTEVDANTKNIVLECANFDMYTIRRTAMQYGLFTDAVTRFTKGQSPLQNLAVLAKIVDEIRQFAGGKVASAVVDDNHVPEEIMTRGSLYPEVTVSGKFINDRLGEQLSAQDMAKLLTNVEFEVQVSGEELSVKAPFWRTDIEIPEDVVEEVGRLYGYDHLPLVLPKRNIKPVQQNAMFRLKSQVRDILSSAGANELLTYTFVHGELLDKVGQNRDTAFQLSNAISPDLQYYRLSLIPSLLERVQPNLKSGYAEFALFEMNPVHAKDFIDKETGLPAEDYRLAFVFAADDKLAAQAYKGSPFYQAREYLVSLLSELGITDLEFMSGEGHEPQEPISQAAIAPFEKRRGAIVKVKDGEFIGELGEFRTAVRTNLKLPKFIAGFELDLGQLLKLASTKSSYVPLPRFPKVEQDISLKVPAKLSYSELYNFLKQNLQPPAKTNFWLAPLDIYQNDQDKAIKHITFRFTVASYERTLKSEEVNGILDSVAAAAKTKLGAERI